MNNILDRCRWPELDVKYGAALKEAVIFILSELEPVGIIVGGSIIRGTPDPASDLDLYVIQQRPVRQRIQKLFKNYFRLKCS